MGSAAFLTSRGFDDGHDGRRAAELVENAAARIAFGWVQGAEAADLDGVPAFRDEDAWRFCILGALASAARAMSLAHEGERYRRSVNVAHAQAVTAVAAAAGSAGIADYNDAPSRSKEEVLAALDRAATRLRSPAIAE